MAVIVSYTHSFLERPMTQSQTDLRNGPDANGLFGAFGGRYVAETLMPLILDLAREYEAAKIDPAFNEELAYFQRDYVGRPSPLYFAGQVEDQRHQCFSDVAAAERAKQAVGVWAVA